MSPRLAIAAPAILALAACAAGERAEPLDLADDTSIRLVGEPESCLQIGSIRSTDVIDDYTIDFEVGSRTYRNRLPNRCPGLKSEDRFSYETSQSRLCNVDIVNVLYDYGGTFQRGAGCGLGQFQEIEKLD